MTKKPNLPHVTEETIKEVGQQILAEGNEKMFASMAVANPDLYRFIYGVHELPDTTKTTMLGMAIGMYHILERQIEKNKPNRKRLKRVSDSRFNS